MSPAWVATAVAVPVFVVLALVLRDGGGSADGAAGPTPTALGPRAELPALEVETPDVTADADRLCPTFIGGLPIDLSGLQARPVRSTGPYAVAWGDPAVVLRCGVPRPVALTSSASLLQIQGVVWFDEETTSRDGGTVWTAVDREVYVDVLVPSGQSSTALTAISTVLDDRLPVVGDGATTGDTDGGTDDITGGGSATPTG